MQFLYLEKAVSDHKYIKCVYCFRYVFNAGHDRNKGFTANRLYLHTQKQKQQCHSFSVACLPDCSSQQMSLDTVVLYMSAAHKICI